MSDKDHQIKPFVENPIIATRQDMLLGTRTISRRPYMWRLVCRRQVYFTEIIFTQNRRSVRKFISRVQNSENNQWELVAYCESKLCLMWNKVD